MTNLVYPQISKARGAAFWTKRQNWWPSRRKLRLDYSNEWRYTFGEPDPPDCSRPLSDMIGPVSDRSGKFRFVILGDTGEGDRSQYGLVPLIRACKPDFMVINGDVAYPAGRINTGKREQDDYLMGLFEPYRDMGCPIWATPGNHEYYPSNKGKEFHETFCSRKFAGRWSDHGLRFVKQPWLYWELKDPGNHNDLVVLGLDSGMTANLDGHKSKWQFWKRSIGGDERQHKWLENRLELAEREGHKVIAMFHIPALVGEKFNGDTHLRKLHITLSSYQCVRLVLAAHEHNIQRYSPAVFREFIRMKYKWPANRPGEFPRYFVSGCGGAHLSPTDFGPGEFPCDERFPSADQYRRYVRFAKRTIDSLKLARSPAGLITGKWAQHARNDADVAQYLSFLVVDVDRTVAGGTEVKVTPVYLEDLKKLFKNEPPDLPIQVETAVVPQATLPECFQASYRL